ncbi:MAG: type III polyketide synthase, partial [Ardenticatenales bacterium]|nr:type III polyketide synthase [Ardenticatenales bacterium]
CQLFPELDSRLTRVVFQSAQIDHRHLVIEDMAAYWAQPRSTAQRNEFYIEQAVPLGRRAVEQALEQAGLGVEAIDDFIVVSCTGLDTPGLDLRLAGALGMRPNLRRTVIGSMGCYGAFPGLNRALTSVLARPGSRALVLCVEVGSIHMQHDPSRETIISTALFADGAAAIVVSSHPEDSERSGLRPQIIDNETRCDYQTFEEMSFRVTDEGFRMYMSSYVPNVLGANIASLLEPLLTRNGLTPNAISHWGIHPGGSRILDHLQESLDLDDEAMEPSYTVLRECGNMSSPTILFVLDNIQQTRSPQPGEHGIIMAFGPGLTMEAALLRW